MGIVTVQAAESYEKRSLFATFARMAVAVSGPDSLQRLIIVTLHKEKEDEGSQPAIAFLLEQDFLSAMKLLFPVNSRVVREARERNQDNLIAFLDRLNSKTIDGGCDIVVNGFEPLMSSTSSVATPVGESATPAAAPWHSHRHRNSAADGSISPACYSGSNGRGVSLTSPPSDAPAESLR